MPFERATDKAGEDSQTHWLLRLAGIAVDGSFDDPGLFVALALVGGVVALVFVGVSVLGSLFSGDGPQGLGLN